MISLKICTYNIHHGTDINGHFTLHAMMEFLREQNPDLVLLQECDAFRPDTKLRMQALWLSARLNMICIYGPVRRYRLGSYGNALLSKWSVDQVKNHLLPDPDDARRCLQVELNIRGQKLNVFNAHLGLKGRVNYENLENIILPLVRSCPGPAILGGDFNANDLRPEIKLVSQNLSDSFSRNSGTLINTFPAGNPYQRIDYLFFNHCCSCDNYYICDLPASDHLPVLAEISV